MCKEGTILPQNEMCMFKDSVSTEIYIEHQDNSFLYEYGNATELGSHARPSTIKKNPAPETYIYLCSCSQIFYPCLRRNIFSV